MPTRPRPCPRSAPAFRLGVLGGGQLGRMMIQEAMNWDVRVEVMDPSHEKPLAALHPPVCAGRLEGRRRRGGLRFRTLTPSPWKLSTSASKGLQALADAGVEVVPRPDHLALIQDKGLQKQAFQSWGLPSAPFQLIADGSEVGAMGYPIVQKLRKGGYDGKGVQVLKSAEDAAERAFDAPCVLEQAVDIDKELSVIVARNAEGEVTTYPVVEAVFDPVVNLVDYLIAPAAISATSRRKPPTWRWTW